MERYRRQIMLPEIGEEGQRRLLASSALIVGLGGLGCPVGLYLAGAGVGCLGLCDADTVGESNLQRQTLYGLSQVGQPKAAMAAGRLSDIAAGKLETYDCRLTEENAEKIIARYDIVMDCCDNFETRRLIDRTCRRLAKPWVHASIGAFSGCVAMFMPDARVSYCDLFPDITEPAPGGVLGSIAGTIGSIAAGEGIKFLAGCTDTLAGKILTVDLKNYQFNTYEL